jgi:hypothetical protein
MLIILRKKLKEEPYSYAYAEEELVKESTSLTITVGQLSLSGYLFPTSVTPFSLKNRNISD